MARGENPLPNWPAVMDTPTAASYIGLSEGSFRIIAARHALPPLDYGLAVTRWRKSDLDHLIDSLPLRGSPSETIANANSTTSVVSEALERVRKRQLG